MKIGVYGLGRFGYFWSALLAEKFTVYAYNRSAGRDCPENVNRCSFDELMDCDVIFICVTISSLENVLQLIKDKVKDGSLVIDTCSVKSHPYSMMNRLLPSHINFLATHPMFGPDSGKDGVEGLPLVFCSGRCSKDLEQDWKRYFIDYGMNLIEMTPEEHDQEAAFTQGITHFVGRVLDSMNLTASEIGTKGYKSLLEIVEQTCNDPQQLFFDLQRFNPYTHDMRMQLKKSIESTMSLLADADTGADTGENSE